MNKKIGKRSENRHLILGFMIGFQQKNDNLSQLVYGFG